jgi:hypothetical protein
VNFFAHAAVAAGERREPEFVLGAMLPDFASMTGRRLHGSSHADVAAGVRHHRLSDAAFHDSPGFRGLWLAGIRELRERGLPRGPARGASHVGIELLLDGALIDDAGLCGLYEGALRAGAVPSLRASLDWSHDDGDARWGRLHGRLVEQGTPRGYADVTVVCERVTRALASRPRLALEPGHPEVVHGWLRELQPVVSREAPSLLEQVRAGLA